MIDSPLGLHASQSPTLVVLAAGLGTRYGGLKQLDAIGPGGSTLMDYSVFDACRAGFRRGVFVVRPELVEAFDRTIGERYRSRLEVVTVPQRLDDLPAGYLVPAGRRRPWGTTHALLAARQVLSRGFAVANADDVYGREAFEAAARFLQRADAGSTRHAVVGFQLALTLSPCGGVHRAVLERSADGTLTGIVEVQDLARQVNGAIVGTGAGARRVFTGDTLVSMNLWAMTPMILKPLGEAFERFLAGTPDRQAESHLPEAVQESLSRRQATVEVLSTPSRWCGLTHPGDRGWVAEALAGQVRGGVYPERPWP